MRLGMMALAAATMMWAAPVDALACSCLPPAIDASYNTSAHTIIGRVNSKSTVGTWDIYNITVAKDFKDGLARGTTVRIATNVQSATCGTSFAIGQRYVIFANDIQIAGASRWYTTFCLDNTPVNQLTSDERDFLRTREIFDAQGNYTCAAPSIPLFNCTVDPCQFTPNCGGGTCEANYCGGCNAEFYDADGYNTCTP